MKREDPQGYIRERGGKLEAVVKLEGRKASRSTGLSVGQEAAAGQFLADLLGELGEALETAPRAAQAPTEAPGEDITFQAWGERWITERKVRGVVSAPDEEAHLRLHAYPKLGATPVRALTKAQMITWVRTLQGRVGVESGKPLSARYIHHIAATVPGS
jgi:hypothetical protein